MTKYDTHSTLLRLQIHNSNQLFYLGVLWAFDRMTIDYSRTLFLCSVPHSSLLNRGGGGGRQQQNSFTKHVVIWVSLDDGLAYCLPHWLTGCPVAEILIWRFSTYAATAICDRFVKEESLRTIRTFHNWTISEFDHEYVSTGRVVLGSQFTQGVDVILHLVCR